MGTTVPSLPQYLTHPFQIHLLPNPGVSALLPHGLSTRKVPLALADMYPYVLIPRQQTTTLPTGL